MTPTPRDVTIKAMTYTPSTRKGGLTAPLVAVPADATTGCEASDYAAADFTGKIALIKRGGCSFAEKQAAARRARPTRSSTTTWRACCPARSARSPPGRSRPAVSPRRRARSSSGTSRSCEVTVSFEIRELQEDRPTRNVIAETPGGAPARTVMLGAHLDSVTEGPGINDNGSGSAGLLDVALKLAQSKSKPANKVRFAWWSAEENGLIGSEKYVAALSEKQREQIALYLNFDMIASPNGVQFVFDGDDSDGVGEGPGPEGSAQLERDINAFLDGKGKPHEGTDFTGRSDYGPFIEVGIPSGGTDTGAEGIKTAAQAKVFGGEAGIAYDPCYHAACDDLDNIDMRHFDTNIDVIANAVGTYAHDLRSLTRPVDPDSGSGAPGSGGSGGGLREGHGRDTE